LQLLATAAHDRLDRHDVFRFVIEQLQPVFDGIGLGENLVFLELGATARVMSSRLTPSFELFTSMLRLMA
jgi:hypothetical protein